MNKNDKKIKDLEDYLKKTQGNSNLDKLSNILDVLIDYYKGMNNKENADKHEISIRTINRWVNKYEKDGKYDLIRCEYNGRTPKIDEEKIKKLNQDLKINPIKLGLSCSIWNGTALKEYINNIFGIQVSKIYCDKLLSTSDTMFKASNYDVKKRKGLKNIIESLIKEYENNEEYSVWYFDTYYLGRNILKEIVPKKKEDKEPKIDEKTEEMKKLEEIEELLMGNDIYNYEEYILYGFYNLREPLEYDIKNYINKKIFSDIIEEFIFGKKQELKEGVKLVLVLESNNVFKSIIDKRIEAKIIFIPKNLLKVNRINKVWDKIRRNGFSIDGKPSSKIETEFENFIDRIFWD